MSNNDKLFAWQETKAGLIFIILFDLLVAYGFASLAIDSGSLLQYFIAIIFLALAITAAVKFFKKVVHGARP
jgi:hypothetical protein